MFEGRDTLHAAILENDKKVLLDLYNSTNGQEWTTKWDTQALVSKWHGIKFQNNRVVEIDLFENNLAGKIPESIGELQNLQSLNLAFQ